MFSLLFRYNCSFLLKGNLKIKMCWAMILNFCSVRTIATIAVVTCIAILIIALIAIVVIWHLST